MFPEKDMVFDAHERAFRFLMRPRSDVVEGRDDSQLIGFPPNPPSCTEGEPVRILLSSWSDFQA